MTGAGGHGWDAMLQRWHNEVQGGTQAPALGMPRYEPRWDQHLPTLEVATAASKFRGKTNPAALAMLMTGRYAQISSKVIAKDLINQWKPNTQVAKEIAVRAFFKFLKALGIEKRFFPEDGSVPEKTTSHTRDEEHALCQFACYE